MAETTGISWADATFNCWWGCTKVGGSPACDSCYAERDSKRYGFDIWGDSAPRRYFAHKHFDELLKWDRAAQAEGVMRRVFVMSMGDWAEGRPEQAEHLERLWERFLVSRNLILMMLTKRPQLIEKLCPLRSSKIWHGVTAETQAWLDRRWPILRSVYSEVYWLSVEPMMESMTLPDDFLVLGQRAWCIVGGESGPRARAIRPEWARRLRDQCVEAGVPFHFKQWGEINSDLVKVGRKNAGRLLDGRVWGEVPR